MKVRRLIPALCMLLVSAILLGTSTYAWFSMNTSVTAASMTVKATTNANLYIAKNAGVALASVTGTAVDDLSVSATALKPAEMTDAAGTVTVKDAATYTAAPTVSSAGTAATYTNIGTVTSSAATPEATKNISDYAAVAFVTIARKQTTAGTYTLTPSCTVACDQASNLNKALRAGVIIDGALYESNDANVDGSSAITFTFSDVTGLNDNTAYSAALLLWFEGEDSDCFVNNAVDVSTNTASWTFTAA